MSHLCIKTQLDVSKKFQKDAEVYATEIDLYKRFGKFEVIFGYFQKKVIISCGQKKLSKKP